MTVPTIVVDFKAPYGCLFNTPDSTPDYSYSETKRGPNPVMPLSANTLNVQMSA